jgi:ribonuclease Z
MKAKHILLNHFSQRYPKIPKMPVPPPSSPGSPSRSQNGKAEPIVSISFDLMSINVSEMWKMAHYMEPISLLFPDEEEGDDDVVKAVATDKNVNLTEVSATPNKSNGKKAVSILSSW